MNYLSTPSSDSLFRNDPNGEIFVKNDNGDEKNDGKVDEVYMKDAEFPENFTPELLESVD
eukprot:CAMPEP_0119053882 /NCGR_PEP_ID=MMETSP1177-20130426/74709_1 /TAXON_ID=2985 /ORGANISM="Ochromonas sp, Strain CCMP1899" /LENGTH=59 /DNA_ID=CAMNT_0007033951 /DNA_START=1905 /DNA_END=2084 /DNA_ORIENTATION=+